MSKLAQLPGNGRAVATLMGYSVILVDTGSPRFTLSSKVDVSPAFRAKFDAWAEDFFGRNMAIENGQICKDEKLKRLYMNSKTFALIRRETMIRANSFYGAHANPFKHGLTGLGAINTEGIT